METVALSAELDIDIAPDGPVYGIDLLNADAQLEGADGGRLVGVDPSGEEVAVPLAG